MISLYDNQDFEMLFQKVFQPNLDLTVLNHSRSLSNKLLSWALVMKTECEIWAAYGRVRNSEYRGFLPYVTFGTGKKSH